MSANAFDLPPFMLDAARGGAVLSKVDACGLQAHASHSVRAKSAHPQTFDTATMPNRHFWVESGKAQSGESICVNI